MSHPARSRPWTAHGRRFAGALLLASVSALAPAALGAQETRSTLVATSDPSALEEGYFELMVERVPGRISMRVWVDEDARVYLPAGLVFELLEVPTRMEAGALLLEWPPDLWSTELVPALRSFRIGDGPLLAARPTEWIERDGQSFLTADLMSRLLGASVDLYWAELTVIVRSNPEFPVHHRLQREARLLRQRNSQAPIDLDVPFRGETGGVAIGWGLGLSRSERDDRADGRLAMGLGLFGGALEVGTHGRIEGAESELADSFVRYSRRFPGSRWIRHVQVGHLLSEGPIARSIVGGAVTNRPRLSERVFGEALIAPTLPSGWEYEVYQGERLVGIGESDAMTGVPTPLNYGSTPVRLRMVGPSGQEVEQELLYVVPDGRVPPGSWHYSLGAGRCEVECEHYGYAELGRGLSSSLTVGAGVDWIDGTDLDERWRPFARLGLSPVPSLSFEVHAQHRVLHRVALSYQGTRHGSVKAQYTRLDPESGLAPGARWLGQLSAGSILFGRWFGARLHFRGPTDSELDGWQGALSTRLLGHELSVEMEDGLQERRMTTLRLFRPLLSGGRGLAADLSIGAALGVSRGRADRYELGATMRPYGAGVLDIRVRGGHRATSISVGYQVRSGLGLFRARTVSSAGTSSFLGADGGIAISSSGVVPLAYEAVGRSGVEGRVFFDDDGDGVRDPGEAGAPSIPVLVGGRRTRTDDGGRFQTWELAPYDVARVVVDTLGVDSRWSPAVPFIDVRPTPNVFSTVEIPLHRGREVTGSVTRPQPDGARGIGGAEVLVIDPDNDATVTSARTFSDGVFYIQRLRPGTYRLELASASARTLGLTGSSPAMPFEVVADDSPMLTLPPLSIGPVIVAPPGERRDAGNSGGGSGNDDEGEES